MLADIKQKIMFGLLLGQMKTKIICHCVPVREMKCRENLPDLQEVFERAITKNALNSQ